MILMLYYVFYKIVNFIYSYLISGYIMAYKLIIVDDQNLSLIRRIHEMRDNRPYTNSSRSNDDRSNKEAVQKHYLSKTGLAIELEKRRRVKKNIDYGLEHRAGADVIDDSAGIEKKDEKYYSFDHDGIDYEITFLKDGSPALMKYPAEEAVTYLIRNQEFKRQIDKDKGLAEKISEQQGIVKNRR